MLFCRFGIGLLREGANLRGNMILRKYSSSHEKQVYLCECIFFFNLSVVCYLVKNNTLHLLLPLILVLNKLISSRCLFASNIRLSSAF